MQPRLQENISFSNSISKHKTLIVLLSICKLWLKNFAREKVMNVYLSQPSLLQTNQRLSQVINALKKAINISSSHEMLWFIGISGFS